MGWILMPVLVSAEDNGILQDITACIVGGTGLFVFDEIDGFLLTLVETDDGFEWKSIDDVKRLGAPGNGRLVGIVGGKEKPP